MELFAPSRNKSKGTATSRVFLFFNRNPCCHSLFHFSFSFQDEIHSSACRAFTKMNWAKKGQRLFFSRKPEKQKCSCYFSLAKVLTATLGTLGDPSNNSKAVCNQGLAWTLAHRLGRNVEEVIHKHAFIIWVDSSSLNFNSLA